MSKETVVSADPFDELNGALETKRLQIQEGILVWASNRLPQCPWRQAGKTPYEALIGELLLSEAPSSVAVEAYDHLVRLFVSVRTLSDATPMIWGQSSPDLTFSDTQITS